MPGENLGILFGHAVVSAVFTRRGDADAARGTDAAALARGDSHRHGQRGRAQAIYLSGAQALFSQPSVAASIRRSCFCNAVAW